MAALNINKHINHLKMCASLPAREVDQTPHAEILDTWPEPVQASIEAGLFSTHCFFLSTKLQENDPALSYFHCFYCLVSSFRPICSWVSPSLTIKGRLLAFGFRIPLSAMWLCLFLGPPKMDFAPGVPSILLASLQNPERGVPSSLYPSDRVLGAAILPV